MCSSLSAASLGCKFRGWSTRLGGGAFFGMYSLGKDNEPSLELHRDEAPDSAGEGLGSDGIEKTDRPGVGSGCGSGIREASSVTDLYARMMNESGVFGLDLCAGRGVGSEPLELASLACLETALGSWAQ